MVINNFDVNKLIMVDDFKADPELCINSDANVVSINASGHKYGLVYPGIGWILWREQECVPEKLIFRVSYLGGEMPTMAINFSRGASQIIGPVLQLHPLRL